MNENIQSNRVEQMIKIQSKALELFKNKNQDYGDAFAKFGVIGVLMRIEDKIQRAISVDKNKVILVNDETINLSVSGSANFNDRKYILKTVDVPADSTVVIEKPINLGAGDKLEAQASQTSSIDVFASILEMT